MSEEFQETHPPAIERRTETTALLTLVNLIHDNLRSLDAKLTSHIADEPHQTAQEVAKIMQLAFPDGDAAGHREAHEDQIRIYKDRADFWKKMLFEVSKWGLLGVLGWAGYALWKAFLAGPR